MYIRFILLYKMFLESGCSGIIVFCMDKNVFNNILIFSLNNHIRVNQIKTKLVSENKIMHFILNIIVKANTSNLFYSFLKFLA